MAIRTLAISISTFPLSAFAEAAIKKNCIPARTRVTLLPAIIGSTLLQVYPRRLEADRFFTSDFNEEVYTQKGLAWINNTESLKDVLNHHHPELVERWMNSSSAFSLWSADPMSPNHTPIYLRTPS